MDNFKPGKGTPRCQLKVVFSGRRKKKLPAVQHQVTLRGAKFPHNVFTITLPAEGMSWTHSSYLYLATITLFFTDTSNAQNFQTFGDLAVAGNGFRVQISIITGNHTDY